MQAGAEVPLAPAIRGGFACGGSIHHEAGARKDSCGVRLRDAAVDSMAEAKIVCIDDQISHHRLFHTPARSKRLANTRSAEKYSTAISSAACLCRL